MSKRPRRFKFFLNPYSGARFTRCPKCGGKTRQRKVPLLIHVEPRQLAALNKICRYCPHCDLLIAHRDEIEGFLAMFHGERGVTDKDYLVLGTLDRADWKETAQTPTTPQEMLARTYEFRKVLIFEPTPRWGPMDEAGSKPRSPRAESGQPE